MKVEELRQQLERLTPEDLRLVAVNLYRMLPKKVAVEKGADELIADPRGFAQAAKVSKAPILPDFGCVEFETQEFLENARAQRYFAPNRIIPKSERSQWRHVARRLYKDWCLLASQPENLAPADKAQEKLYRILCRGCEVYLFPSTDTFKAIGVPQPEFLEQLFLMKAQLFPPEEWIPQALSLLRLGAHGETLSSQLQEPVINALKTPELKEAALKVIDGQLDKRETVMSRNAQGEAWQGREHRRHLLRLGFQVTWALGEKERAVQWLKTHASGEENAGHLLLLLLLETKDREFWMREYEALHHTKPSETVDWDKTYEQAKLQGKLPDWQVR